MVAKESAAGSASDALDPFVDALAAAGKAAAVESAGDPKVIAAVELGWLMRELTEGWSPDALLAGLTLDNAEKCQVQGQQLTSLLGTLKLAGPDSASLEKVTTALQIGPAQIAAQQLRPNVIVALLGADARFPTAFLLGDGLRALIPDQGKANSGSAPTTASLVGALDSLSSSLPSHAARAVANSLGIWSASNDATKAARAVSQVSLWRSVIVGEKKGTELLEPNDYLDAARQLETSFARRALRSNWLRIVALIAVVLFGLGIYFLFAANGQAGKVAAGASGVLAAVGLTWKGIGGTLGALVGKLEAPLWGAELDAAITDAITLIDTPKAKRTPAPAGLKYADRRARAR